MLKGAPHSYEIPFVFGTLGMLKVPASAADAAMADAVADYWTAFAKTGKPAVKRRPAWPALAPGQPRMMVFSANGPVLADSASAPFDALAAHAGQKNAKTTGSQP